MNRIYIAILVGASLAGCAENKKNGSDPNKKAGPITLVIHGGAGTIKRENMTPEKEKAYHEALMMALDSGYAVLEKEVKALML